MGRKIGYVRVSKHQQNWDLQIDALIAAGVEKRDIFKEKETGSRKDRPELERMLEYLEEGDTVYVFKLDRIGRSLKHLITLVETFKERGIHFVSLKENIDTDSATGKLMFNLMASFAEFEREMILERTLAGLASSRARGRIGGRPKKDGKEIEKALKLYDSKEYSAKEIQEMTGISKATLYRYINERKGK